MAPITTTADINSDGVTSHRTLTVAGADALPPTNLNFNSSPQVVDEGVNLSCALPANEPVNYAMGDESSHVNGNVTEGVGIGVGGSVYIRDPIFGDHDIFDLGPFTFHLFDLPSKTFTTINLTAPGKNVDLGNLLPNNIPPKISAVVRGGSNIEGQDVTFTAAESSPCGADSLHTEWHFSNPNAITQMVAYGPVAHVVFPDNGIYEGYVKVTDPTGLTTTQDLTPFTIGNALPIVDPVNKQAEWGDVVNFHVDAFDTSSDQSSLAYEWTFGDGQKANGRDVTHVFSTPGSYAGSVIATDKDLGVSTPGSFTTVIAKRATTLVYTGATSALTNTAPTLSATLGDDHGQAVNGGVVSYTLGSQSIGAASNLSGLSSIALALNQDGSVSPGVQGNFAGNSLYLGSSASAPFAINKRKTLTTYVGDLNSTPNKNVVLAARVTDELGQPVAGASVLFNLGVQSITAVTDTSGLANVLLHLSQNPGAYVLRATYAESGRYVGSVAGPLTFGVPNGNGASPFSRIARASAPHRAGKLALSPRSHARRSKHRR